MTLVNPVGPRSAAGFAICPLCHTADSTTTGDEVAEGARWRCKRCSQMWNAERLATYAEYGRYVTRPVR